MGTTDQDVVRTRKAELEDAITQLAGEIHAATYRFLTLLAEFDRLGGWQGAGVRSLTGSAGAAASGLARRARR